MTTLVGDESDMPSMVRSEIQAAYPSAMFVSRDEAEALFVDGVVAGRGLLVSFDVPERLKDDVVGVAVTVTTARDGALGQMVQFQWNETDWQYATPSETGVTQTTSVS
jgi:hypothetical protein